MPADPQRVKELFAAALDLPFADRDAFLDGECGPDAELRHRVEVLLRAHDQPESALERPLAGPANPETARYQPDHATESAGTIIAGRYKLLEAIGEGGMGEVWVADQLEPIRRRVALKLIKPGMDSRAVLARFEAERQALALMDHPNIAKVLDAGTTDDGRPYFVMELVKGTPITAFCDERRLSTRERLELFIPVCQAIQHAHQKGIIHRDIKPSNVLVALHDEHPVPKVIDFGVAKAIGQQLTEKTLYTGFGALIGTPAYMAPEQATFNQLDIDTRADIYSLGVLLYELLAGSPPFEAERLKKAALDEVLRLVREEEPPRPSQRLSTSDSKASIAAVRRSEPSRLTKLLRGELDWVVMKALEKDRNRRYETANGFAIDVQRYLADEAVLACPPSVGYRLRKFVRRNKHALITAAVVLVAIVSIAGINIAAALRRQQHATQLTEMVKSGLADARVAMAEKQYGRAQGLLTGLKSQLAEEQQLWATFGPEIEPALRDAELQLRVQRFFERATDARYLSLPLLTNTEEKVWTPEQIAALLTRARGRCRESLEVFQIMEDRNWLETLQLAGIDAELLAGIKGSAAEMLLLLSRVEYQSAANAKDPAAGAGQALPLLEVAERLSPNVRALYEYRGRYQQQLGDVQAAKADLQRAEEITPDTWLDHYLLATSAWDKDDLDTALEHIEAAIALKPDDYWSWFSWGEMRANRRHDGHVLWAMTVCINLKPEEPAAWIIRAYHRTGTGNHEAALRDLDWARKLEQDTSRRAQASMVWGMTYFNLHQYEKALAEFSRSLEFQPGDQWVRWHRGRCYWHLGRMDEARADGEQILRNMPKPVTAQDHHERGWAFSLLDQTEQNLQELQAAMRLEKFPERRANCQHATGWLFLKRGELDKSIEAFQASFNGFSEALGPMSQSSINSRHGLAYTLMQKGRYEEAEKHYREILTGLMKNGHDDPRLITFVKRLALVLQTKGDQKALAKLRQENPRAFAEK